MNSFRDFEKSLCILRDRTCINILDPDQNSGANGILCYGYVDHAAGLTFEGLALVSCMDDDYTIVLEDAGFSNIQTEILYDIVLGWTDEGEVKSVSIDGRTDFKKGEVFKQDVPVVITYHMKEEDDPNKPVETTTSTPKSEETEKPTEPDKQHEYHLHTER